MRALPFAFAAVLACFSIPCAADGAAQRIDDVGVFLDQQRDLRDDMRSSKKFKHVTDYDRRRLYSAQDKLFELLEGRRSIDELDKDELIAVYNAQEEVNAVLTDAELDRPICKREKVVGTHRAQTVCLTVRERNDLQNAARMNRYRSRTCDARLGGCGG